MKNKDKEKQQLINEHRQSYSLYLIPGHKRVYCDYADMQPENAITFHQVLPKHIEKVLNDDGTCIFDWRFRIMQGAEKARQLWG